MDVSCIRCLSIGNTAQQHYCHYHWHYDDDDDADTAAAADANDDADQKYREPPAAGQHQHRSACTIRTNKIITMTFNIKDYKFKNKSTNVHKHISMSFIF